jgi:hypothetical protein
MVTLSPEPLLDARGVAWQPTLSKSNGKYYFFNATDNENRYTTGEVKSFVEQKLAEQLAVQLAFQKKLDEEVRRRMAMLSPEPFLDDRGVTWQPTLSKSTGKYYFFSAKDNESLFTMADVKSFNEQLAELKLAEQIAEKKLAEQIAEQKLAEQIAEKKLAEQIAEQKLAEQIAEQQKLAEQQMLADQRLVERAEGKAAGASTEYDGGATVHVYGEADLVPSTPQKKVILILEDQQQFGKILLPGVGVVMEKLNSQGQLMPSEARKYGLMEAAPAGPGFKRRREEQGWSSQQWGSSSSKQWGSSTW